MYKVIETPKWAEQMTEKALELLDCGYNPKIVWKNRATQDWKKSSSGLAYSPCKRRQSKIVIRAGKDEHDQKETLLHEICHIANAKGNSKGHTKMFYRDFWFLADYFNLDLVKALKREYKYKKTALSEYVYYFYKQREVTKDREAETGLEYKDFLSMEQSRIEYEAQDILSEVKAGKYE